MVFPLNLPTNIKPPASSRRRGPASSREGICTPHALTLTPELLARVPVSVSHLLRQGRLLLVTADDRFAAAVEELATEGTPAHTEKPRLERLRTVTDAAQALRRLSRHDSRVDLVICDAKLRDGGAGELLGAIAEWQPQARLVVSSDEPTLDEALASVRDGAIDYLPRPINRDLLRARLAHAVGRQYLESKTDRRLVRLKRAVRQLNSARRAVSRKVDLLCNDLVGAYSELSKQMEEVRVGENLRQLLESSADLEQMLCRLMDWLLRELGNCNIAIFLTDEEGRSELGAYMKYTVPGEEAMMQRLAERMTPRIRKSGSLSVRVGEEKPPIDPSLARQHLVGVDCTYLAESLGTLMVFRDEEKAFTGDAISLLNAAARAFAVVLTGLVHEPHAETGRPEEPGSEGGSTDDWWRQGDEAPF